MSCSFLAGLGVAFSTGARHKLETGAVVQPVTGLHVHIGPARGASVSTQIATVRRLLTGGPKHGAFKSVAQVRNRGGRGFRALIDLDFGSRAKYHSSFTPTARISSPP